MKKTLYLILIVLLATCCISCDLNIGNSTGTNSSSNNNSSNNGTSVNNNTKAGAIDLTDKVGEAQIATLLTNSDEDWYKVWVPWNYKIQVSVENPNFNGEDFYNIELTSDYTSSGFEDYSYVNKNQFASVSKNNTNMPNQYFYIRIYGGNVNDLNYNLTVTLTDLNAD